MRGVWSRASRLSVLLSVGLGLAACGGGAGAEPEMPDPPTGGEEAPDPSWETEQQYASDPEPEPESESPAGDEEKLKAPEFTEGMTVAEAISAVPSHYDYIGLDQEVLAKPLVDIETYKECNVKTSDKFTVRIAVWGGKVVGADVKSPNKTLEQCIDRVVRQLEYKDKVESINTVEYTF